MKFTREFSANVGMSSIGSAGPDAIERDFDNISKNLDPAQPGGGIAEENLTPGAATDAIIGNRTVDPSTAVPASDTGSLTQLLSWITKAIAGVIGADWKSSPAASLASLLANAYQRSDAEAALALKADLNSPTFTGAVSGITKAMVGLENVDNTADATKSVLAASKLTASRKIGADFDGTADITMAAIGGYTQAQVDNALALKEPANPNIQAHVTSAHAPVDAQKNSDITKAEIEAKLTGEISSHTHAGGGGAVPAGGTADQVLAKNSSTDGDASWKDAAPVNAQKNSDITKAEIEAKLTGEISSHTHAGGGGGLTEVDYEDLTVECQAKLVVKSDRIYADVDGFVHWYFDPTGSDTTGDGTWVAPYQTITKILDEMTDDLNGKIHCVKFKDPTGEATYTVNYPLSIEGKTNGAIWFGASTVEFDMSSQEYVIANDLTIVGNTARVVFSSSVTITEDFHLTGDQLWWEGNPGGVVFENALSLLNTGDRLHIQSTDMVIEELILRPGYAFSSIENSKISVDSLSCSEAGPLGLLEMVYFSSVNSEIDIHNDITAEAAVLLFNAWLSQSNMFPASPLPAMRLYGRPLSLHSLMYAAGFASDQTNLEIQIYVDGSAGATPGNNGFSVDSPISTQAQLDKLLEDLDRAICRQPVGASKLELDITFANFAPENPVAIVNNNKSIWARLVVNGGECSLPALSVSGFTDVRVEYLTVLDGVGVEDAESATIANITSTSESQIGIYASGYKPTVLDVSGCTISNKEIAVVVDFGMVAIGTCVLTGNEYAAVAEKVLFYGSNTVEATEAVLGEQWNRIDLAKANPMVYDGSYYIEEGIFAPDLYRTNFYYLVVPGTGVDIAAPVGMPFDGMELIYRIADDGTIRTITWDTIYSSLKFALPTTTLGGKSIYCIFRYNGIVNKWEMVDCSHRFVKVAGATGAIAGGMFVPSLADSDFFYFENLSEDVTILEPTGPVYDGAEVTFRIEDDGTRRSLFWGFSYIAQGYGNLPDSTSSDIIEVAFRYHAPSTVWYLVRTNFNPVTSEVSTASISGTLYMNCSRALNYRITAQAAALTVGTPVNGRPGMKLQLAIKDNGTARALSWSADIRPIGVVLPTTTISGKLLYIGLVRNSADFKWDCVAVAQEA